MAHLDRRTTLRAAGLATVATASTWASGCTVHGESVEGADPTQAPMTPEMIRDVALAARLAADVAATLSLARRTLDAHPPLSPRLRPLLRTQRAHLRVLRRAAGPGARRDAAAGAADVAADQGRALALVVRSVQSDRTALNRAAVRAASGRFAQLLAGMGAGLSQRLVVIGRDA